MSATRNIEVVARRTAMKYECGASRVRCSARACAIVGLCFAWREWK